MTRGKYLDQLTQHFGALTDAQVREIAAEIYAHFEEGAIAGKTDEEIALALGDPADVAREYLALYQKDAPEETRTASPLRMFGEEAYVESWRLPLGERERLEVQIARVEVAIDVVDGGELTAKFEGHRVVNADGSAPKITINRDGEGILIKEERADECVTGWISRILSNVPRLRGKLRVFIPRKIGDMSLEVSSGVLSVNGAQVCDLTSKVRSGKMAIKRVRAEGDMSLETHSGLLRLKSVKARGIEATVFSGSVDIDGIDCEALHAEVFSGKIEARAVSVAEEAAFSAKSGRISLDGASARKVSIVSQSGGVLAEGVRAEKMAAEANSGAVKLRLESPADVDVTARSGSIDLAMPKGEGFTYEAETASGSVSVEFGDKREEQSDNRRVRRGVVGGGLRSVSLKALSGHVSIRESL